MKDDAHGPARVHRVALPPDAAPPIRVYVNGEEWRKGADFTVDGATLHFVRTLRPQPTLGLRRKVMLAMGIGVYGDLKGDALDVQYTRAGAIQMETIRLTMDHAERDAV